MAENDSTITDLPETIEIIANDDWFVADDTSEVDPTKKTKKVSGATLKTIHPWKEQTDIIQPRIQDSELFIANTFNQDPPSSIAIVNTPFKYPSGAFPTGITQSGNYVYHVTNSGILSIFDVSDPPNPVHIVNFSNVFLSGANDIKVKGNFVYITSIVGRFIVVDVTNHGQPTIASTLLSQDKLPNCQCLEVAGQYAYVTSQGTQLGDGGLTIIDINDPTHPFILNSFQELQFNGSLGIYVLGDHAYTVGFTFNSLNIFNIKDPFDLKFDGNLPGFVTPFDVVVSGKYAFVSDQGSGKLSPVDISDPTMPLFVGTPLVVGNFLQIVLAGDYIYASSDAQNAIFVIDIKDPLNPKLHATLKDDINLFRTRFLHVAGKYLYVSTAGTQPPATPYNPGELVNIKGLTSGFDTATGIVAVTDGGVDSIGSITNTSDNYTDPTEPVQLIGTVTGANAAIGNAIVDGFGNISSISIATRGVATGKMVVIDVGGINIPSAYIGATKTGILTVTEDAEVTNQLSVGTLNVGNRGMKSDGIAGFQDMNVYGKYLQTAPFNITKILSSISTSPTFDGASDVVISGNYAYVAATANDTLNIVDVTDPKAPLLMGTIGTPDGPLADINSIFVANNLVYACAPGDLSLHIIDVSNSKVPVLLGKVSDTDFADMKKVTVVGNFAYIVSGTTHSFRIVNVTDPKNPFLVGSVVSTPQFLGASDVIVRNKIAYVVNTSDGSGSLRTIDVSDPLNPVEVGTGQGTPNIVGIAVSEKYLYALTSTGEFDVFGIGNPIVIESTGVTFTGVGKTRIIAEGNYLYISDATTDTINIVDVSNPLIPVLKSVITDPSVNVLLDGVTGIAVTGRNLYAASTTAGVFSVIDLQGMDVANALISTLEVGYISSVGNARIENNLWARELTVQNDIKFKDREAEGLARGEIDYFTNEDIPTPQAGIITLPDFTQITQKDATTITDRFVVGANFSHLGVNNSRNNMTFTPSAIKTAFTGIGNFQFTIDNMVVKTATPGSSLYDLMGIDPYNPLNFAVIREWTSGGFDTTPVKLTDYGFADFRNASFTGIQTGGLLLEDVGLIAMSNFSLTSDPLVAPLTGSIFNIIGFNKVLCQMNSGFIVPLNGHTGIFIDPNIAPFGRVIIDKVTNAGAGTFFEPPEEPFYIISTNDVLVNPQLSITGVDPGSSGLAALFTTGSPHGYGVGDLLNHSAFGAATFYDGFVFVTKVPSVTTYEAVRENGSRVFFTADVSTGKADKHEVNVTTSVDHNYVLNDHVLIKGTPNHDGGARVIPQATNGFIIQRKLGLGNQTAPEGIVRKGSLDQTDIRITLKDCNGLGTDDSRNSAVVKVQDNTLNFQISGTFVPMEFNPGIGALFEVISVDVNGGITGFAVTPETGGAFYNNVDDEPMQAVSSLEGAGAIVQVDSSGNAITSTGTIDEAGLGYKLNELIRIVPFNAHTGNGNQRWQLVNAATSRVRYVGNDPFKGMLSMVCRLDSVANNDYEIGLEKNTVITAQSGEINIPKPTQVSLAAEVNAIKGDEFEPKIRADGTNVSIAVTDMTFIIE